jgi:hypothetical protein
MTDEARERVRCHVCDAESEHTVARRATEEGTPDLDTRPPETLRSTMPAWVQRCPSCGYCAPDLTVGSPRAARVVRTAAYQTLLTDPTRPALANAFLAASAVFAGCGTRADAGWQAVYAAWACDDAGDDLAATACRLHAVEHFASAMLAGQDVAVDPGGADAVIADLLRRAGHFEEAIARVEATRERRILKPTRRVLLYIASLAAEGDRAAHAAAEAPPLPELLSS